MQVLERAAAKAGHMTDRDIARWRAYSRAVAKNFGVRSADDLDDIEQACLVDVCRSWDWPKGDRDDYMGTVVRNRCLMWLDKARRSRHHQADDDAVANLADPKAPSEGAMVDAWLAAGLLNSLEEDDARLIRLAAEGHSEPQIAAIVGASPDAVKVALKRIKRQLRRRVAPNGPPDSCVPREGTHGST